MQAVEYSMLDINYHYNWRRDRECSGANTIEIFIQLAPSPALPPAADTSSRHGSDVRRCLEATTRASVCLTIRLSEKATSIFQPIPNIVKHR